MQVILQIAALTILLFAAQAILRRASKWVLWSLFMVLPIVLTPYWLATNEFGLFLWIKCYSVFFCVTWGTLLRFTSLGERSWARFTIPLLLAANILEATILDVIGGGLAHSLNAFAGMILIATIPYGWRATRIDSTTRCRDLYCGTSLGWICGYLLWNWTFVYLNYPSLTGHHTAVLLASLIVALTDSRRWLQTRACTLGINLFSMATINNEMISWLDTTNWCDERLAIIAAGISLTFMVGHTLWKYLPAMRTGGDLMISCQSRIPTLAQC